MSTELVMPSNHLILCRPLLPPPVFPSIRVFSNESVLHIRWPKYWSFSFSISPSNEYSELISFRMDWFDLLAVQGTPRVFSSTTVHKHQFLDAQPSLSPTLRSVHDYWGEGTQFSVYLPFPKVEAKLSPPAFFAARVQAYVRPNVPSTQ